MLIGMQGSFTKYLSFLCLWDSHATDDHYNIHDWPLRITYEPGRNGVQSKPLVEFTKIFLPNLHIKLGLMKNFVKAMCKANSRGFQYLTKKSTTVSAAQLKEGIFVGAQIREVLKDDDCEKKPQCFRIKSKASFHMALRKLLGQ